MTKTERAVDATAAAVRSAAAGAAESRRDRVSRYATVAKMAAVTAGIGGVAGAVDAAIVSGNTAVVLTTSGSGANVGIGDAVLANVFSGGFFQQANVIASNVAGQNVREARIKVRSYVHPSFFSTRPRNAGMYKKFLVSGAVVDGNMTFGIPQTFSFRNRSVGPATGDFAAVVTAIDTTVGLPVVIGSSNSVRGYVGFRFDNGGTDNFGYFDVEWSRSGVGQNSTLTLTIHGWAYDNSGAAITIGGATPIPGGTGLAALAIGAVGLRGRRRSRN